MVTQKRSAPAPRSEALQQQSDTKFKALRFWMLESGKREFNDKVVWCFSSSEAPQKRQRSSFQKQRAPENPGAPELKAGIGRRTTKNTVFFQ
jgi:hypothetical protein